MDCSFGHGEFSVDVSQALKQFQFSNRKNTISLLSTNDNNSGEKKYRDLKM
jgi:hypothetical protein